MQTLKQHILPVVALLITGASALVVAHHRPHSLPMVTYRYPGAVIVIYAFFRFVALSDKRRTAQLDEMGLFRPLRDGAFLLCTHAQLFELGIVLGWLSPFVDIHLGALGWAILLTGFYAHRQPRGLLGRLVNVLPAKTPAQRARLCNGFVFSGVLGVIGSFVNIASLAWSLAPLALVLLIAWRAARSAQ